MKDNKMVFIFGGIGLLIVLGIMLLCIIEKLESRKNYVVDYNNYVIRIVKND